MCVFRGEEAGLWGENEMGAEESWKTWSVAQRVLSNWSFRTVNHRWNDP